jgi:hypothetical protein
MARSRLKRVTLLVGSFQRPLNRLRGMGCRLKHPAVGTATVRVLKFRAAKEKKIVAPAVEEFGNGLC